MLNNQKNFDDQLKNVGGFNAINYFYTILEFDTVSETWLEVSNMRSARGGPGVSVIDFNHLQNYVSDCYSGRLIIKSREIVNTYNSKALLEISTDRRPLPRPCTWTGVGWMGATQISRRVSLSDRESRHHRVRK